MGEDAVSASATVSLLSYNVYCLPWIATYFSPSSCPYPDERATGFLSHILNYDILALQEVWSPRSKYIENFAKKHGLHLVSSHRPLLSLAKLQIYSGGLMILSKYPIERTKQAVFVRGTHSDSFTTKGALYALINVGAHKIHVFNTHLQASYDGECNPDGVYASIRKKQLSQLASFINSVTCNDAFPILLMGDFNVNAIRDCDDGAADSEEYMRMLAILRSDLYHIVDVMKEFNDGTHPVTHKGMGVLPCMPDEGRKERGQRLDFLLELRRHNEDMRSTYKFIDARVVPFSSQEESFVQLSDHFGVSASMQLFYSRMLDGAE